MISMGFTISGSPTYAAGTGAQNTLKVLSESPLTIQTINAFPNYGVSSSLGDGLSSKGFGIFCMAGNLFLHTGRQNQSNTQSGGGFALLYGNLIMSADHGATWNNPDNIASFTSSPRSTLSNSMWPGLPSTMGGADFVHTTAPTIGTLGYLVACNQHDNGNAYVYLVFNEGITQGGGSAGGGNVLYIARCPRAKLSRLNGTDWQFYKGGGLDGNLDSNWSASESALGAIISNAGKIGNGNDAVHSGKESLPLPDLLLSRRRAKWGQYH